MDGTKPYRERGVSRAAGSPKALAVAVLLVAAAVTGQGCTPEPGVLVGAGDISSCSNTGDTQTASLVDGIAGTVVTFGDNVYNDGSPAQFANCYGPTWGRFNDRVRPSPGNHDYRTSGASGYFGYFGSRAGPSGRGYYFYDTGNWRIFSLNSEANIADGAAFVRANSGGKDCIAAYWHKAFRSSGQHGNMTVVAPLWQAVYDVGGDLVLSGHDHSYERFTTLDRAGAPTTEANGMRELVVGTGGNGHYGFSTIQPGSQVRNSTAHGVIVIELGTDSYNWSFRAAGGAAFTDTGTGTC